MAGAGARHHARPAGPGKASPAWKSPYAFLRVAGRGQNWTSVFFVSVPCFARMWAADSLATFQPCREGPAGWATLWAGRTVVCQRLGGGGGQGPGPRPRCACLDSLHPRISHRPDCDPGTSPRHSEIRAHLETSLRPQWRGGRRVLWTHGAGPADGCCSVRLTCCGRLRTPRPNVAGSPAS